VFLFLGVGSALPGRGVQDRNGERVTYVSIAELPEPALPEPSPIPEEEDREAASPGDDRTPDAPSETDPVDPPEGPPAGFQELVEPDLLDRIPEPDLSRPAVSVADFRGRGIRGGVAGDGRLFSGATGGQEDAAPGIPEPIVLERMPVLLNADALEEYMLDLYPPELLRGRVEGTVVARFMVLETGRVEEASIEILSASHDGFREPTRRLLTLLEWEPYRRNRQAFAVPVEMPVYWTVQ